MIKVPVSSNTPTRQWPRPGAPDFTFVVRSYGGQLLGAGLTEFDWTLQVESRLGLVSLESFRSDADMPGEPTGVFRLPLDDAKLQEFERLAAGARLGQLQSAMTGHPGYTQRLYTFTDAGKTIQQTINNSDEQTNATIAPLRNRINALLGASFDHPERAVKLGIRPASGGFEVTITNIGTERVCFADPQSLVNAGPLHGAAVMVSEFPQTEPGEPASLNWEAIPLGPRGPSPHAEKLVVLEAKGVWRATVAWKRPAAKRYLAYFALANYDGEALVNQVYRIRGRVLSPRLVIEP